MYPARTEYRVAHSPAEYRRCHAFFKAEAQHPRLAEEGIEPLDYETEKISYPTVYAWRDEKVVGVIATKHIPNYGLVAAPFHVAYDIKNHVPVTLRLLDCYEYILRVHSVPEYWVVVPNYKPSALKIFGEMMQGTLTKTVLNGRFNIYQIPTYRKVQTPYKVQVP